MSCKTLSDGPSPLMRVHGAGSRGSTCPKTESRGNPRCRHRAQRDHRHRLGELIRTQIIVAQSMRMGAFPSWGHPRNFGPGESENQHERGTVWDRAPSNGSTQLSDIPSQFMSCNCMISHGIPHHSLRNVRLGCFILPFTRDRTSQTVLRKVWVWPRQVRPYPGDRDPHPTLGDRSGCPAGHRSFPRERSPFPPTSGSTSCLSTGQDRASCTLWEAVICDDPQGTPKGESWTACTGPSIVGLSMRIEKDQIPL